MDSPTKDIPIAACPHCGGQSDASLQQCAVCGCELASPKLFSHAGPWAQPEPLTMSLRTLFLLMTLCAMWATAAALNPLVGVVLVLLSLPAIWRTRGFATDWYRRYGISMPPVDIAMDFVLSLMIVIMCLTCVCTVFAGSFMFLGLVFYVPLTAVALEFGPDWASVWEIPAIIFTVASALAALAVGLWVGYVITREVWGQHW